ncbi:MAG: biopolymer transporter ExbD [Verrucomicrobiae bacterium]|nr:biopolymer transporter ExbD [Verrucomicrobiae bacterium]MCP5539733.1 biopolymer transporter ExbD [Akkermansiaceae bacterium]MCP5549470.1 biopolymer transporter ExbD [Akkermansiaceae bacterium]
MASAKARLARAEEEELSLDMSPMIDLVFLLLIFFMVSSHMIIVRIDRNVKPPVAENAKVAENNVGRIVINVYEDGRVFDPDKKELESSDAITAYVDEIATANRLDNIPNQIHLRADKNTDTRNIKKVVQAAAAAGVTDVIFGSYVDNFD